MLLNQIELFVTVARNHNLGKTAREMHVSASSVCQRLKSLENDLGAKLYKKNKQGIELTGAGQTLLTAGSEVLTKLETLKKALNSVPAAAVQTVGERREVAAELARPLSQCSSCVASGRPLGVCATGCVS